MQNEGDENNDHDDRMKRYGKRARGRERLSEKKN